MAVATNLSTSAFPFFSSLAPELRDQIWRSALPANTGPTLCFYKKGLWRPKRLSPSDETWDPQGGNLYLEFRHDLFDDIQFEVPLVFVNREARNIALVWLREQGIETRHSSGRQSPLFVRLFNSGRDALYIAPELWDDFLDEPEHRRWEPDLLLEERIQISVDLGCIAVPESLLRSEAAGTLGELFHYFFNVKVLLVIANPQPDMQSAPSQPWEFESIPGGSFFWNADRRDFDLKSSEDADDALHKLIIETNKNLRRGLVENQIQNLEVRAVFAIKR